ncbi:hypothetical protein SEA_HANNACONDA_230 [Mycobacterium phage Hannaconda]|nr:hypothetical protein SEA_HANNACONDA_230 [Mycobacterium phage Hannaconda]QPO16830.1 hypothetical protein SEA_KASHFLOW_232 [Mycobacterium phage KashFlow]
MRTIYSNPVEFVRESRAASAECSHGVPLAYCGECVRYSGECDMGGCTRAATTVAHNGPERRPVCSHCVEFARSLGMSVEP